MLGFTKLEVRSYFILCTASAIKILINQLEQPYARSLVICDTPVNTTEGAEFSGSRYCGNRLRVIGQGAQVWGRGDSLENLGRLLITLFLSGYVVSSGRKAAAVVGWVFIMASTVLFLLAELVWWSWSPVFFIVAQALQGMSGLNLVGEIVIADIARKGDSVGVYTRRDWLVAVLGLAFHGGAMYVQLMEITDFRLTWAVINLANLAVMMLLLSIFPETQPEEQRSGASPSIPKLMANELRAYRDLCTRSSFVRCVLMETCFRTMADGLGSIAAPVAMAYYGFSQVVAVLLIVPVMMLMAVFTPLMQFVCKRLGHRRAFLYAFMYDKVLALAVVPVQCYVSQTVGLPFWTLSAFARTAVSGMGSVNSSLVLKLVEQKDLPKLAAMNQIIHFLANSISSAMYSAVFDAEATTYRHMMVPFVISALCQIASIYVFYNGNGPVLLEQCDQLTLDAKKEAQGSEATNDDAPADGSKKQN